MYIRMIDCDWRRTYGHAMCLRIAYWYIYWHIDRIYIDISQTHIHTHRQH